MNLLLATESFVGTRFETVPPRDPIELLIARADLDWCDADAATAGLCGTFALALFRVLKAIGYDPELCVVACVDAMGQPAYDPNFEGNIENLHWRHVVVRVGSDLYDVDGRVLLGDLIENFCWASRHKGGCFVVATFRECARMMRATKASYDGRYSVIWKRKLRGAVSVGLDLSPCSLYEKRSSN